MVSYLESVDYFEKQVREMKKKRKEATKNGDENEAREIADNIEHVVNAITMLRKNTTGVSMSPIPWDEIEFRKGKPVYILEQNKDTKQCFCWWDIIDEVSSEWVRTSYSEEMLRSTKGMNWDMFDVEVRQDSM